MNNLIRPKFTSTKLEHERKKEDRPVSVKFNDEDRLMLDIGMYMFNMHTQSGVLKKLAHAGLKELLRNQTMDEWHYLTKGDRERVIRNRPDERDYLQKGST